MFRYSLPAILLIAIVSWLPAFAQEPQDTVGQPAVVEISGLRDPALKSYAVMLQGMDAFEQHHAYAPAATLRFQLRAATQGALDGVTLQIRGDHIVIAVPLADDASFMLPRDDAALADDADLMTNKKKGAVRWRPNVNTPGLKDHVRRLGDLRLECMVAWAVLKEDMPLVARTKLTLLGGPCMSSLSQKTLGVSRKLQSARLVEGQRSTALHIGRDKLSYIAPLHDKQWSNEAQIEFSFDSEAQNPPATP